MHPTLTSLIEIADRHACGRRTMTAIPRVLVSRRATPEPPQPTLCQPAALFVLQGSKTVLMGERTLRYDPGDHFIYTLETPATAAVLGASATRPYLAIGFRYEPAMAAALLDDAHMAAGEGAFNTQPVDDELLDAWLRMLRLLDRPREIPVLAPLIEREILFRLLQGPHGARLRLHVRAEGPMPGIRRSLAWIRAHYQQSLRVEHLARIAHMSVASFHRHFKAATRLSPIQYQRQVRLLAARQLLMAQPRTLAHVAFAVGYRSLSHFAVTMRGSLASHRGGTRPDIRRSSEDQQHRRSCQARAQGSSPRGPAGRSRRLLIGVTTPGSPGLAAASVSALKRIGFRNITPHWLQAKKAVS
jgi:AraC-like DNA-binding protein